MNDLIGIVADQLTQGYLEPCEIHDALIRTGMTEEEAYLTYVAGRMVFVDRKTAFEAKQAGPVSKPTVKIAAVRGVSLVIETPPEMMLDDRNDPPHLT